MTILIESRVGANNASDSLSLRLLTKAFDGSNKLVPWRLHP